MPSRRWLLIVVATAAISLLLGRVIARIYTDYLWYTSLGAAAVWRAKYSSLITLRLLCGVAASLFVFANLYAVRQSVVSLVLPRRIGNIDIGEEVPRRHLTWMAAWVSLVIGMALAWSQRDWSMYLAARVGQPFGESDPYFSADLGFFVHRLPFELSLFTWTMTMVLIVIVLVVVLYALTPSLRWDQGRVYVSGYVRRHFTMLAGVLLLVLAWHYRLEMYTILGQGSAEDGAFTSLDHRVGIPGNLLLALATLGAGLTVLWAGWTGQLRLAFAALTGVIVAAVAAGQLAPFIASRAMADGDPVVRERPYVATRAGYTRRAFAVDRISPADNNVRFASLADAAPFVPVWDEGALLRASERALPGASVGWFASDSGITAAVPTVVSGGAVVMYTISGTDESGTTARTVRSEASLAPSAVLVSSDSAAAWRIVADSSGHIAAPSLSSSLTRFAHALSMQELSVWLSDLPSPSPKLIARASVRERLEAIVPFFAQGSTIAPLWVADSLLWAVEMYSTSRTYPLSRREFIAGEERAYFQHAATALVNATTGRVVLVADSISDPIAETWRSRFPGLFKSAISLPVALLRQLPPAREGARAQAMAFGRFGTREETSVPRHVPFLEGPDSALVASPAPVIAFPRTGQTGGTTGYVLPLLDRTEKLRGLFIAFGGPAHRSVWLSATEPAPVWTEALDRLRAADTMSGASLLVRGFMRAVPLADRIILMQPRYDWRRGVGGAPRLMYVSALIGDSVRSARTFLQLAGRFPDTTSIGGGDLRTRAQRLYDEMVRAAARGDWTAYGRAFDALGALLRQRR